MPGRRKNGVPDRWVDYTPLGKPMEGTRFISFKVPLVPEILRELDSDLWFSPEILVKRLEDQGHHLGLIIDLTNTQRYYGPKEVTRFGIKYQKIYTEGHAVPSKQVQGRFKAVVDDFLARNADNEALIGVHCTHGLNRTGYLVCRYLIDAMKFTPCDAIKLFNDARGHELERENYLKDLKKTTESDGEPEELEGAEGRCYPNGFEHHSFIHEQSAGNYQHKHPPYRGGYREHRENCQRQPQWPSHPYSRPQSRSSGPCQLNSKKTYFGDDGQSPNWRRDSHPQSYRDNRSHGNQGPWDGAWHQARHYNGGSGWRGSYGGYQINHGNGSYGYGHRQYGHQSQRDVYPKKSS